MTTEIQKYNRSHLVIIDNQATGNSSPQGVLPQLLCDHNSTNTFSSNNDLSRENIKVQAVQD